MATRDKTWRKKAAAALRGYELEDCSRPTTTSFKTLADARKAARSTGGRIRQVQTGRFIQTDPTKPKPTPAKPRPRPRRTPNKPARDKLGGLIGAKTTILTTAATCLRRDRGRYRLVEVDKLLPSHDGQSFRKSPGYPPGIQERRYHTDKTEQQKVIGNAQASCFDPALIVNTDPSPLGGPSVVTPSGLVLSGNSRAMVLQRVWAKDGASAREYRQRLKRTAADFGFDVADVAALKQPVLVRVVALPPRELKDAVRRYNEILTQEMDVTARQVATSARINGAIIGELSKIGDEQTLYEWLKTSSARPLVVKLQQRGVIARQQANALIKAGLLNDDGRRFFARALVGRILPNADLLDLLFDALPSLRENLARAVPYLVTAGEVAPKWNVANVMPDAAQLFSAVRASGAKSIQQYLKQRALFESGAKVTTASVLLAQIFLERNGARRLASGFRRYAAAAKGALTVDLFGAPSPPVQALAEAFGLPLVTGPAVLQVSSFSPTAIASASKARRNGNANPKTNPNGEATGKSCKGGLSMADIAVGRRLYYVDVRQNGDRRRFCFRSVDRVRWVVVGVPQRGKVRQALSWHTTKKQADKAAAGTLAQRARVVKTKEDTTGRRGD